MPSNRVHKKHAEDRMTINCRNNGECSAETVFIHQNFYQQWVKHYSDAHYGLRYAHHHDPSLDKIFIESGVRNWNHDSRTKP